MNTNIWFNSSHNLLTTTIPRKFHLAFFPIYSKPSATSSNTKYTKRCDTPTSFHCLAFGLCATNISWNHPKPLYYPFNSRPHTFIFSSQLQTNISDIAFKLGLLGASLRARTSSCIRNRAVLAVLGEWVLNFTAL